MKRVGLGLVLLALTACDRSQAEAPKPSTAAPAIKAIAITTARAEARPVQRNVETTGSLVAWEESQVKSEVPGTIDKIFVDLGDRGKASDPSLALTASTTATVFVPDCFRMISETAF